MASFMRFEVKSSAWTTPQGSRNDKWGTGHLDIGSMAWERKNLPPTLGSREGNGHMRTVMVFAIFCALLASCRTDYAAQDRALKAKWETTCLERGVKRETEGWSECIGRESHAYWSKQPRQKTVDAPAFRHHVQVTESSRVAHCKMLGGFSATERVRSLFGRYRGDQRVREKALGRAKRMGATHAVWTQRTRGPMNATFHGLAYDCGEK